MMMRRFQMFARLTIATMAAAVSLVGGLVGLVRPAEAQTAAYPNATNTGVPAGTALTIVNGNVTISTAGAILENKDIRGCVVVNASNVIIRKSKIACPQVWAILIDGPTNLLVEDVDIICNGANGSNGIIWGDYTARRVDISNCENMVWVGSRVTVEDSYLHDPMKYGAGDPHIDTVQTPTGARDITIRHNTIYAYMDSSAAQTAGYNLSNVLIADNVYAGGGYSLRVSEQGANNVNVRVRNNRFSTMLGPKVGYYGPWDVSNVQEKCGNVYHETGGLLSGQVPCSGEKTPSPPSALQVIP